MRSGPSRTWTASASAGTRIDGVLPAAVVVTLGFVGALTATLAHDRIQVGLLLAFTGGLLVGTAVGLLGVFVWDRIAMRLTGPSDVERATGQEVLATIPTLRTDGIDRSALATGGPVRVPGAYARLRARLAEPLQDESTRCLLVTSPHRGAGRTTIAVNLAASMAADGMAVAVVSTDARSRRRLDHLIDLEPQPGLTEVLNGSCSLETALQTTGLEGLSVLAAGAAPPRPGVGYSLDDLAFLLERLSKRFDLVVLEAPPVLEGPAAALLAQESDLVVVAVDVRHDRRPDASLALSYLEHVDDRLIGCIVNDPGRRDHRLRLQGPSALTRLGRPERTTRAEPSRLPAGSQRWAGAVSMLRRRFSRSVGSRRRWPGVVAAAAAVAVLTSSIWWLSADHDSLARPDNADGDHPADVPPAPNQQDKTSDVEVAMARCRAAWHAQAAALNAATNLVDEWQAHVRPMKRLAADKMNLVRADRLWQRTRTRAAKDVRRFARAENRYRSRDHSCSRPSGTSDDELESTPLPPCKQEITIREDALRAARTAVDTWQSHKADMNKTVAGTMEPRQAVRRWEKSVKHGVADLRSYARKDHRPKSQLCKGS